MFAKAYLDTAASMLERYDGHEPFQLFLKSFFATHKQFGARDRRFIAQLCYSWLRTGHGLRDVPKEQQLITALFLCTGAAHGVLKKLAPQWNEAAALSVDEKISLLKHESVLLQPFFPWQHVLSTEVDATAFDRSFLLQPLLYLRLRPGKEEHVKQTLQQHEIAFQEITPTCIALPNGTNIDNLLPVDRDVVVQDRNSQNVLQLLKEPYGHLKKFTAWDCCAASGGKSLLLHDLFPNAQLTVSDVRESILHNLRKRFQAVGIKTYKSFVANAATDAPPQQYDVVLCDVPCTGSGTWSRTPENLQYFVPNKIDEYAALQKRIVANAARFVKPGGWLLYSTCSVFKKENEEVVECIREITALNFFKSAYYKGYQQRADTLFAALFQRSEF